MRTVTTKVLNWQLKLNEVIIPAMEAPKEFVNKVKDLIDTNQPEKAIELLEAAKSSLIETELILIKADFNKIPDQQQIGIINNDDSNPEFKKLNTKDDNESNNCVIDTFRTDTITY